MVLAKQLNDVNITVEVKEFNDSTLQMALGKFREFQKTGVILNNKFEDAIWTITDEKHTYNIEFNRNEIEMFNLARQTGNQYSKFIGDLKQFLMLWMGRCSLESMRTLCKVIIDEAQATKFFSVPDEAIKKKKSAEMKYLVSFLRMEHIATDEYNKHLQNALVAKCNLEAYEKNKGHKRVHLNEFESYFLFDYIIRDFWNRNKDIRLRHYYFPLYLYWVVTTILPQRVTEFCIISRDCVRTHNGKYYLTIRRSKLKGAGTGYTAKERDYHIETDYSKTEYEIPEWLYQLFEEYKNATESYDHSHNTLFSLEFMCDNSETMFNKGLEVFDGRSMNKLLRSFYADVVLGEYGYTIVDKGDLETRNINLGTYEMFDDEIMMLQLKHTRHLAMINLNLRGVNPMIIKEFSGHESDEMASHYYGNFTNLVRCAVKRVYDLAKKHSEYMPVLGSVTMNYNSLLIDTKSAHMELDNGSCYSEAFAKGDVSDCRKCNGNCERCEHYVAKSFNKQKAVTKEIENRIDGEAEMFRALLYDPNLDQKIEEYQHVAHQFQSDISALIQAYIKEES